MVANGFTYPASAAQAMWIVESLDGIGDNDTTPCDPRDLIPQFVP